MYQTWTPTARNKPGFLLKNPNKSSLKILKYLPSDSDFKPVVCYESSTIALISPIKLPLFKKNNFFFWKKIQKKHNCVQLLDNQKIYTHQYWQLIQILLNIPFSIVFHQLWPGYLLKSSRIMFINVDSNREKIGSFFKK